MTTPPSIAFSDARDSFRRASWTPLSSVGLTSTSSSPQLLLSKIGPASARRFPTGGALRVVSTSHSTVAFAPSSPVTAAVATVFAPFSGVGLMSTHGITVRGGESLPSTSTPLSSAALSWELTSASQPRKIAVPDDPDFAGLDDSMLDAMGAIGDGELATAAVGRAPELYDLGLRPVTGGMLEEEGGGVEGGVALASARNAMTEPGAVAKLESAAASYPLPGTMSGSIAHIEAARGLLAKSEAQSRFVSDAIETHGDMATSAIKRPPHSIAFDQSVPSQQIVIAGQGLSARRSTDAAATRSRSPDARGEAAVEMATRPLMAHDVAPFAGASPALWDIRHIATRQVLLAILGPEALRRAALGHLSERVAPGRPSVNMAPVSTPTLGPRTIEEPRLPVPPNRAAAKALKRQRRAEMPSSVADGLPATTELSEPWRIRGK